MGSLASAPVSTTAAASVSTTGSYTMCGWAWGTRLATSLFASGRSGRLSACSSAEHDFDSLSDVVGREVGAGILFRSVAGQDQDGTRAGALAAFDVGALVADKIRPRQVDVIVCRCFQHHARLGLAPG